MNLRQGLAASLGMMVMLAAAAEPKTADSRYGIAAELRTYPQTTAKETLQSVVRAIEAKRFDYLVAQLADPAFVDDRIERLYGGRFAEQVEDTRGRLDSRSVRLLRRFLKEGQWRQDNERGSAHLKGQDCCVNFTKKDGRWFMQHASKPKG